MMNSIRSARRRTLLSTATVASILALAMTAGVAPLLASSAGAVMHPRYDGDHLLLPEDWRTWVFIGASLGLSYSEGSGGSEMFHETLMEPTAYAHFSETGEFREGTMLALLLQEVGENTHPQRGGRFASEVQTLELAVKDSRRADGGWSYYGFGDRDGLRDRAPAVSTDACADCHIREAAHDNVFVQFYPLLASAAPEGTIFRTAVGRQTGVAPLVWVESDGPESDGADSDGADSDGAAPAASEESAGEGGELPVAVSGFDPVLLMEGQDELGKPEIVFDYEGWRYQFASEPTRAKFESDPERYAYRTDSCVVVPGARIDPDYFTIHDGALYGFAGDGCLDDFEADPERYLSPQERSEARERAR